MLLGLALYYYIFVLLYYSDLYILLAEVAANVARNGDQNRAGFLIGEFVASKTNI